MTIHADNGQAHPIDYQIDFLSRQLAEADAARRHAQEVSSALVMEKRELEAKLSLAVWPNVLAPAMYDNPDPGWEDPRVPDLAKIRQLAREVGYSIGLHGSLKRDVDLIAAPWTDEAVGNAALVDHICAGLPAERVGGPEHKPYGRVAVTLQIDGYFKPIDLSIMPRVPFGASASFTALQEELAMLRAELNTPELLDFSKAVNLEAAHQRQRWGSEHDAGKTDADWFWLVGYLVGKALHKSEKRLHHLITAAAALANWHLFTLGKTNMRPGIEPPQDHLVDPTKMVASETIASVTAWANETFGAATVLAQIMRAEKEWLELKSLLGNGTSFDKLAEEAADVCICLYRVIGTLDPEAINKKMAINRARKWNVDGQGCAQHVGE